MNWSEIIRRAIAVKVKVIQIDPFEKDFRSVLNFGHTIGHALERVSEYHLRHGEAVAIGMVVEAKLGEGLGISENGLSHKVESVLLKLGLPTTIPAHYDPKSILDATLTDKKRRKNVARYALPHSIGKVLEGIEVDNNEIMAVLTAK